VGRRSLVAVKTVAALLTCKLVGSLEGLPELTVGAA
jgi:hypothetical protein